MFRTYLSNGGWILAVYIILGVWPFTEGSSNYAFNKTADQIENYLKETADLAIDGNRSTCTSSVTAKNPWWKVDLGREVVINNLKLFFSPSALQVINLNYSVEVQASPDETGVRCNYSWSTPTISNPKTWTCNPAITGQIVSITAQMNTSFTFCEVEVYGECVDGTFGDDCQHTCGRCNLTHPICDKTTGTCPYGCDYGWTGNTCSETCPFLTYGKQCSGVCGHCAHNQTCSIYNGNCPDGQCDPGWQEGLCNKPCDSGYYGVGCQQCGACRNNGCHVVYGNCSQGCLDGYMNTDPECRTPCDDGAWGRDCVKICGFCATPDGTNEMTCNISTGHCDHGCAPGYYEDRQSLGEQQACRTECPGGKWGLNCAHACGNCGVKTNITVEPIDCRTIDGACMTGCLPGYKGTNCVDACDSGTYGKDCDNVCGQCLGNCYSIDGECPGACKDGYLGTMCDLPCQVGYYGAECKRTCPINCATNCSNVDGSCICKDGWTGLQCSEVCPNNHYGKNCEFTCANCLPGTTCNQDDGYCAQGCATDWTGLKCDAAVIREFYEPDYTGAIVGAVFGVIGLGLIITFIVWVVWRYRNDKSIHVRELASSLKRISLRGSKNLRRSIQRLSMRMKRGDQRGLQKNADTPAESNHHHQKSRATNTRMYDCVKIQSNVLHHDDFCRIYLHLQQSSGDGKTLLHEVFQSFMVQRPRDHNQEANGHAPTPGVSGYYNAASEDEIQLHVDKQRSNIPEFLPLGSNLSGFLLVNAPAASADLWGHLQQRQIETIISIGKECSFSWRPGERITISNDVVDCVDVQMYGSHRETKLHVQRQGTSHRRSVRHLECFFFTARDKFPQIQTLLMFMERFHQLQSTQRGRSIIINYLNLHDQAILFSIVASLLEILQETKRVDILRTVAIGGKATAKSIRTFEEYKYLNDVLYNNCATDHAATSI